MMEVTYYQFKKKLNIRNDQFSKIEKKHKNILYLIERIILSKK